MHALKLGVRFDLTHALVSRHAVGVARGSCIVKMRELLRLRTPDGQMQLTLDGDPSSCTLGQLRGAIASELRVEASALSLRAGFPPRPLTGNDNEICSSLEPPITSGDTVIVTVSSDGAGSHGDSLNSPSRASPPSFPAPRAAPRSGSTSINALQAGDGYIVRRIIPSDNSCLFNAVAYVAMRRRSGLALQLRQMVADEVLAHPADYSEAVLERPPDDYRRWILDPDHWGGAIELRCLAARLGLEICAINCQSLRVDRFGEEARYPSRVFVFYDGIHYDAVAIAPTEDAPEDFDATVFPTSDDTMLQHALGLAQQLRAAGQFTDTANFTLRCQICGAGLRGEAEAREAFNASEAWVSGKAIDQKYADRRALLAAHLPPRTLVVCLPACEQRFSHDVFFRYRPNPELFYLTGFMQPHTAFVMHIDDSNVARTVGFARNHDAKRDQWEGTSMSPVDCKEHFGLDEGLCIDALTDVLTNLQAGTDRVLLSSFWNDALARSCARRLEGIRSSPLQPHLDRLRVTKSRAELALMKQAALATQAGFARAWNLRASSTTSVSESAVALAVEFGAREMGCERMAYPTISAGGSNANVLHYLNNDQYIAPNSLVLVDAGGEMGGYAADVSRTWPVSGKFTSAQGALYDLVLEVQKDCIRRCVVGTCLDDVHAASVRSLTQGLLDLGILQGTLEENLRGHRYARYYPHHVGHYLGLDVHDTPSVPRSEELHAGTVVTVEPGLYIPVDDENAPADMRGVGIRIEDDVLIDLKGPVVLTEEIAKDPNQLEELLAA